MIELLKSQVKHNLEIINHNEEIIREVSAHPESAQQLATFQQQYLENKNLLAENNDFTNLQLTLLKFLSKYRHIEMLNDSETLDEVNLKQDPDYVFELTVSGKIPFNPKHPYYGSKDFFTQLMMHFENMEQYEKCQQLIEAKRKDE